MLKCKSYLYLLVWIHKNSMAARASWIESNAVYAQAPQGIPQGAKCRAKEAPRDGTGGSRSAVQWTPHGLLFTGQVRAARVHTQHARPRGAERGARATRTAHLVVQRRGAAVAADTNGLSTRAGCTLDEERARAGVRERAKQGASVRTCFSQASRTSRASRRPTQGLEKRGGPSGRAPKASRQRLPTAVLRRRRQHQSDQGVSDSRGLLRCRPRPW